MRESAVVRLIGGELFWYPPGSSADPRSLDDEAELAQLILEPRKPCTRPSPEVRI